MTNLDIRQLHKQIRERRKFEEENKLLFLKPLPDKPPWPKRRLNRPETQFMNVYNDGGKIPYGLLAVGGNKTAKTYSSAMRGVCLAIGEHPFLPEDHPLRYTHKQTPVPNIGIVAGEHLTQVVDKKLVPTYMELIPRATGFVPRSPYVKKNPQGIITKIEIPNDLHGNKCGSIIHFISYTDHEAIEGIDYHWVHFDEPPPQKLFTAAIRGLVAYDGVFWIAFTSLKEPWIYDMAQNSIDYGGTDKKIRVVEFGSIYNNHVDNGGFLSTDQIENFKAQLPAEEIPTRIDGKWMTGGERIFGSFKDESPYVCPDFEVPKHWTFWEGLNPHDGKDSEWLFFAVSPQEINMLGEVVHRVFCIDYLRFPSDVSITEMVHDVKIRRIELGYDEVYTVVIDAKHGKRTQKPLEYRDEETWEEKLNEVDIGYIELADQSPGRIDISHKIVREYLKPQFYKLADAEIPGIVFFERCRGVGGPIEGMLKYRFKKNSDKPEEDEFKDVTDPVRYVLMKQPTYVEKGYISSDEPRVVNRFTGR